MSSSNPIGDRVLCYNCGRQYARAEGGLECPNCGSDFVEVVSIVFFLVFGVFLEHVRADKFHYKRTA